MKSKECTILSFLFCILVILVVVVGVGQAFANQPPIVDAGPTDTVPWGRTVSFNPQIDDDSTPIVDLIIRWRQLSGPVSCEIYDSTAPFSAVLFSQRGVYTFLLTATDHQGLSSFDTVVFYVRDPVPFQVITPVNKQPIAIGQAFTIKWQNEGHAACRVYVSFDDGLTETMISKKATQDSLEYVFDFDQPPGTVGLILVRYYPGAGPQDVVVSGSFVLVEPSSHVVTNRTKSNSSLCYYSSKVDGKILTKKATLPQQTLYPFDAKGRCSIGVLRPMIGELNARTGLGVLFFRQSE